jgi:hypothetical protein
LAPLPLVFTSPGKFAFRETCVGNAECCQHQHQANGYPFDLLTSWNLHRFGRIHSA